VQLQAGEEVALPQCRERAQLHRRDAVLAQQCHPCGGRVGRALANRSRAGLAAITAITNTSTAAITAIASATSAEHRGERRS